MAEYIRRAGRGNEVAEAFWHNENRFYLVSGENMRDEIVIAFHQAICKCVDTVVMIGDCEQYDAIDNDRLADILTEFDVVGIWDLETTGYQTMTRKNR